MKSLIEERRLWMDTERAVGPRRSLRTAAFAPQART